MVFVDDCPPSLPDEIYMPVESAVVLVSERPVEDVDWVTSSDVGKQNTRNLQQWIGYSVRQGAISM